MFGNRISINVVPSAEPGETDAILTQARAKIIWGDSADSVRDYLTSNRVSPDDAAAHIAAFCAERNLEIRRLGLRHTCIGAAIMGGCGIVVSICLNYSYPGRAGIYGRIIGFCILGMLYGLWRLSRGMYYLFFPKSEHGSIPDLE